MNPGILQSFFYYMLMAGTIFVCFGTIGYRCFSKKVDQEKERVASAQIEKITEQNKELIAGKDELITQNKELSEKIEKYHQITISRLDELLESTDNENKNKLLEKYPAGYALFGADHFGTFSSKRIQHGRAVLEEYEIDWSKVKIENLTSTSLYIQMPKIRYKPLDTRITECSFKIPRRPLGKEIKHPINWVDARHTIFYELLKDDNQQLIFVIGFRKTE